MSVAYLAVRSAELKVAVMVVLTDASMDSWMASQSVLKTGATMA